MKAKELEKEGNLENVKYGRAVQNAGIFMNTLLKDTEKLKQKNLQKIEVSMKVNKKAVVETLLQAIGVSISVNNKNFVVKESMIE